MRGMKLFEMGSLALLFACSLRTCNPSVTKTRKELETEYYSLSCEDKCISIIRTRRLYSVDPLRWEKPIPSDEGLWENDEWVSMSNMYAIVVIDSDVDEWVLKRGTAECLFFYKDMSHIGNFCVYNAKNDTLKSCDDRGLVMGKVVDLEELFNRHKACPCIFIGNGKKGVLFWRAGLGSRWCGRFTLLLWAGRPVEYYTFRKFKTWDDFSSWDGNLEETQKTDANKRVK